MRSYRWLLITIGAVFCIWIAVLFYKWPFREKAVQTALEAQSSRVVRIGAFHFTFFPPGYIVENIRFSKAGNPTRDVTMRKLVIVARYRDLLLLRRRVEQIVIAGVRAPVPQSSAQPNQPPTTHVAPRFSEIGNIRLLDVAVSFPSSETDPDPLTVTIQSSDFNNVSGTRSGNFAADILFNEPQGAVRLSGQLGPWNWNDIGRTPLAGAFTLPHADLANLGGVEGLLHAAGKFTGSISHIVCTGTADVPEFLISKSSHSVNLSTTFRAGVNALTGDTNLETAESHFNRTVIQSQGVIKDDARRPGKATFLRFSVQEGQIGDLLLLFTRAANPSMTGTVDLRLDVELPPGAPGFLKKLMLSGDFGIDRGRFTKAKTQIPLNHLSESARGMGKTARDESHQTVLSDLAGHVSAQSGIATMSHISFAMPGAHGVIAGTYNLLNHSVNLKGSLTTPGELASASSGMKAVLLKLITPLMKKHSETVVPFSITGTAQHPNFALDILNKLH